MALSTNNFVSSQTNIIPASINFSIGKIGIVTTDGTPFNNEKYLSFSDLESISSSFGVNSRVYKIANAMFNTTNGFTLTSNYEIIVMPVSGVTGSRANFETPSLSGNLATLQAVSDGSLTVEGTLYQDIDLTNATTLTQIKNILQDKVGLIADVTLTSNKIKFTSKNVGADSTMAITTGTAGTDLIGATLLNIAGGTATAGIDSTVSASDFVTAVSEAREEITFSIFTTDISFDSAELLTIGTQITTTFASAEDELIFVYNVSNKDDLATLTETTKSTRIFGALDSTGSMELRGSVCSFLGGNDTFERVNRSLHAQPLYIAANKYISQAEQTTAMSNNISSYGYYGGGFGNAIHFPNDASVLNLTQLCNIANIVTQLRITLLNEEKTGINKNNERFLGLKNTLQDVLETFAINEAIGVAGPNQTVNIVSGDPVQANSDLKNKGYYVFIPSARVVTGNSLGTVVYFVIGESIQKMTLSSNIIRN